MAYNKDNYENNRLTAKQEKFCQEIASGKTQYEAYINAYPNSKKWERNAVDCNASKLLQNTKIIHRLKQLRSTTEKKVVWNRLRALKEVNYVLEMHKKDMERIDEACQTEIDLLNLELDQKVAQLSQIDDEQLGRKLIIKLSKEIKELNEKIARLRKQRRVNGTNTHGILEATKILNRMYGLDITKVEIKEPDADKLEARKLSVEELRAIAYTNRNTRNTAKSD